MRRFQQILGWLMPVAAAAAAYYHYADGEPLHATFFAVIAAWTLVNACREAPRFAESGGLLGQPKNSPNREVGVQLTIGLAVFVWTVIWVAEAPWQKALPGISAVLLFGGALIWFLLHGPMMWTRVGRDLGLEFYPARPNDPGLYHGTLGDRMVSLAPSATGTLFRVRVTGPVDESVGAIVDLDQWLFGLRAGPDARLRRLDELGGGEATCLLIHGTRDDAVRVIRQLVTAE